MLFLKLRITSPRPAPSFPEIFTNQSDMGKHKVSKLGMRDSILLRRFELEHDSNVNIVYSRVLMV